MKVLIIEDEQLPAETLKQLLSELVPHVEFLAILQSITESADWFMTHTMPDLVFMDIHLADGSAFSIFNKIDITCPIIFTTAYDQYALKAFEVNSIDYLLKPIDRPALQRALNKMERISSNTTNSNTSVETIQKLAEMLLSKKTTYKSSLLISVKDKLIPLAVKDIAYFYIDSKIVKAVDFESKSFYIESTLDDLAKHLNPDDFFRANRQYIVARTAVKDITLWFGNRVVVNLKISVPERILVSRTNVREFKEWLTNKRN